MIYQCMPDEYKDNVVYKLMNDYKVEPNDSKIITEKIDERRPKR